MRLVEWARSHQMASAVLAGLLVGTVLGLAQPIRASAPDPDELASWRDPGGEALERYDEAMFARIRDRPIWGGEPGAQAGAGSKKVQWRLAGIMSDPAPTALVFVEGQDTAVQVHVGDTLPDGGEVTGISSREITFARAGCQYEKALYSVAERVEADCPRSQ